MESKRRPYKLLDWLKAKVARLNNGYAYITLAIAYLFVITFFIPFGPISPGLDNSWRYAMNFLANSDYVFGRDIVFTYGPLAFLKYAQNIGNNMLFAAIFWLILQITVSASLSWFLFVAKRKLQVILFTICYLIWFILSYTYGGVIEYQLLATLSLLLCVSLYGSSVTRYASTALSGILACIFLFIKFSAGMSAFSMLAVFMLIIAVSERKGSLKFILTCGLSYIATMTIFMLIYFKSAHNLIQWFLYSLGMATGYGEAISVVGSTQILVLGILVLLVYLVLLLVLLKQKAESRFAALIFAVPVFIAFKHSFCRQDGHEVIIFCFLMIVAAVLMLNSVNRKELLTCSIGFLVILTLAIPAVFKYVDPRETINADLILGKRGWANITAVVDYKSLLQNLDQQSEVNLLADKLQPGWVRSIGDSAVDVIPYEICYCPANKLKWDPIPTIQAGGGFGAALDLRNAAHYADEDRPGFIIAEFAAIDGHHLLFRTPASWRSIFDRYELLMTDGPHRLLLEKKLSVGQEFGAVISSTRGSLNRWIDVPISDNLLFAKMDMQSNLLGIVAKIFFRIPPVNMELLCQSGRIMTYRMVPDTARNGLLINFLPADGEELAAIFSGVARDRVIKFRIIGDGAAYYNHEFALNWEQSNHKMDVQLINRPITNPPDINYNKNTLFAVDSINGQRWGTGQFVVEDSSSEQMIIISGWAVDEMAKQAAGGLFITIDGKLDVPVSYGSVRDDVATYFGENNYRFSGFTAVISTALLDPGQHMLSLKIISADRTAYYMPDYKIDIIIK